MQEQIGDVAGRIWAYMNQTNEVVTSYSLTQALRLTRAEVDRALGWLAREGQLEFETTPRNATLIRLRPSA
ncbi:MAG: winged helix-turn-helix domain-containing protein [Deltaproteobacteria bacterium]|nr:winged helix-turn-helix domain-containing protein [Deltaproteobacteria bacterium]